MSDIASLKSTIKGDVVVPDDPSYPEAIARWAKNSERNAKVVVFVKDANDAVTAIAYAKANKLPLAIRGGGHSAGGASSTDGLVVDLSRYLNTVRVDASAKLAYVGGGALWKDVDAEAIKHGLATVGGTVNHVSTISSKFQCILRSNRTTTDWGWRVRSIAAKLSDVCRLTH